MEGEGYSGGLRNFPLIPPQLPWAKQLEEPPLQGKPNGASRDDWAVDEETSTKIVAAIKVEISIRTAILPQPTKGATPLVAFIFPHS